MIFRTNYLLPLLCILFTTGTATLVKTVPYKQEKIEVLSDDECSHASSGNAITATYSIDRTPCAQIRIFPNYYHPDTADMGSDFIKCTPETRSCAHMERAILEKILKTAQEAKMTRITFCLGAQANNPGPLSPQEAARLAESVQIYKELGAIMEPANSYGYFSDDYLKPQRVYGRFDFPPAK